MGSRFQDVVVRYLVKKKCNTIILHLPGDLESVNSILFVAPEDPIEALLQTTNIISIVTHFSKARIMLLCEESVASFFKNISGIGDVIEYQKKERYLFSSELIHLGKMLEKEYFDLCCFLERNPDISLLHLMGLVHPQIRITYSGVGAFPYFNFQVQSRKEHEYRRDQNNVMAQMLGAQIHEDLQWTVSKEILEEIKIMIKEHGICAKTWLGGIDARFLYYTFGEEWTRDLIESLLNLDTGMWYLYIDTSVDDSFFQWIKSRRIALFSDFPLSRLAALISSSNLIISGKTFFYELAFLLHKPSIGIFHKNEINYYFRNSHWTRGISYNKISDEGLIENICSRVTDLSVSKKSKNVEKPS